MSRDPVALLEGYVSRKGHALVPKSHIEHGFALGQWSRSAASPTKRAEP